MLHRHLNHSEWTLAAIDDVIARGRLDDWKELRDAAANRSDIQQKILRVSERHLSDPYAQRYHFWNFYIKRNAAEQQESGVTAGPSNLRDRAVGPSPKQ